MSIFAKVNHAHLSLPIFLSPHRNYVPKTRASSSSEEFPPNALRRKRDPQWRGGFSLGVDLGMSRSGLALSKGFSVHPLTVLELRGQNLELRILEIAGNKTNKVRSVAGRLAVRAAERGWRVYLQDEHGTTSDATGLMLDMGLSELARQRKGDAYAAMIVLERYFSTSGVETELVLPNPKHVDLLEKLRKGPPKDRDFILE